MANLSSKTGFTPVQTQVSIPTLNTATNVQDFAAYEAQELTGFVYVDATADLRCSVKVMVVKNGAGTYEVAAVDLAGDNYASAPLVSFSMSGSVLRATLPAGIPGFTSAYIKYQLNAPALGGQFPLTVDSTSINVVDSAPLSYRNKIINGAFQIAQRGTSFTLTAAAAVAYGLDRWYASCTGANTTLARVAGSNGNSYALQITGAASNTATLVGQRIEAQNCYDLVNKTVTCSLRVSSTSITSLTWTAYYANSTDTWSSKTQIATGTLTISSTDGGYSFSFNAGANAANGIAIEFTTGALLGSQTITYQQVQLELGAMVSGFERRPIGMELSLCQRYATFVTFTMYTTGFVQDFYMAEMRTTPTVFTLLTSAYTGGAVSATTRNSFKQSSYSSIAGSGTGIFSAEL